MKLTYLSSVACAAVLVGGAIANAQTTSGSYSSAQQGSTDTPTPGSQPKGNDLDTSSKSPKVDPASAPPTAGQNKGTGNNMVAPNGTSKDADVQQASANRPEFGSLDTQNKGKLTAADVRSNAWLSKNFSRCDTDHDGTLSRSEYNACH
jgi:hypothetical protein